MWTDVDRCGPMWIYFVAQPIVCIMHANIAKKKKGKPGEHTCTMVDPIPRHKIHTPPQVDVLYMSKKIRSLLIANTIVPCPFLWRAKHKVPSCRSAVFFHLFFLPVLQNMGSEQLECTNNNTVLYNNHTQTKTTQPKTRERRTAINSIRIFPILRSTNRATTTMKNTGTQAHRHTGTKVILSMGN